MVAFSRLLWFFPGNLGDAVGIGGLPLYFISHT